MEHLGLFESAATHGRNDEGASDEDASQTYGANHIAPDLPKEPVPPSSSDSEAVDEPAKHGLVIRDPELRDRLSAPINRASSGDTSRPESDITAVAAEDVQPESDWRAVIGSSWAQVGALSLLGVVCLWVWPVDSVEHSKAMDDGIPRFPRLEVEGVPPLSEDEARQLLDRVHRRTEAARRLAAQSDASASSLSTDGPPVMKMQPGTLIDPEMRRVVSAAGQGRSHIRSTELTDRHRDAADASRVHGSAEAAFYEPGGFIAVPWATRRRVSASFADVPMGQRVAAQLEFGVSSAGPHLVIARVLRPVVAGRQVALPRGTLLRGRCRWDGERAHLELTTAQLKGRTVRMHGVAVQDRQLGIAVTHGASSISKRLVKGAGRGTLEAASDVASTLLSTTLTGRVLDGALRGVRSEAGGDLTPLRTERSHVPEGTRFEVLILDIEAPRTPDVEHGVDADGEERSAW